MFNSNILFNPSDKRKWGWNVKSLSRTVVENSQLFCSWIFFVFIERKEESLANNSNHEPRTLITEHVPPPEHNSFTMAPARKVSGDSTKSNFDVSFMLVPVQTYLGANPITTCILNFQVTCTKLDYISINFEYVCSIYLIFAFS